MKLGMLSQWFDPEPGPAAIPGVYAREFVRAGHDVSVLTGFPNYPQGKLYAGYRQHIRDVSHTAGINLIRVPLYPNHDSSSVGRVLNYTSFAASATLFGGSALRDVDAVWVYNSPVTVSLPLLTHTRRGDVPYFLHIQDLWPDSLIESGLFPGGVVGKVATRVLQKIVHAMEKHSAVIGVISPSVRELILSRNPDLAPSKIVYVPNPTDEGLFRPVSELRGIEERNREDSTFQLMYVGAIGDVQGLGSLLDAAELLKHRPDISFVIVGDGIARARLERDARTRGLTSITFQGRISKELIPHVMATADAQLVSLADSEFLRYTTPSKIASLLASEVPIIGHIAGDGARLLEDSGAALISAPGNAEALAATVARMADMRAQERQQMANRGRAFYSSNLSSHIAAKRIVEALRGSMNGN
jgi:glycosyltransferase involved in cell wall biosynthesis